MLTDDIMNLIEKKKKREYRRTAAHYTSMQTTVDKKSSQAIQHHKNDTTDLSHPDIPESGVDNIVDQIKNDMQRLATASRQHSVTPCHDEVDNNVCFTNVEAGEYKAS